MSFIYGLIHSDTLELRYIGQTIKSLNKRFIKHKLGIGANIHLNRWTQANPINIIVLERNPKDIDEAEIRWIREMKERGARLLNLTKGGQGRPGGLTLQTRAKISATRMNLEWRAAHPYLWSPEVRAKMSVAHKGILLSIETRARMSNAKKENKYALGHVKNAELKDKLRINAINRNRNSKGQFIKLLKEK